MMSKVITSFFVAGNACFFLLLFELAIGPFFVVSRAWLNGSILIGVLSLLALVAWWFKNRHRVRIQISPATGGRQFAFFLALYCFLIFTAFLYALPIAYTYLFGTTYQRPLQIQEITLVRYKWRYGGGYFEIGKGSGSDCYAVKSSDLKRSLYNTMCIRTESPHDGLIMVSGKKTFFGKTISDIQALSDLESINFKDSAEINEFWETN